MGARVTVVTATYGALEGLKSTVASVREQDFKSDEHVRLVRSRMRMRRDQPFFWACNEVAPTVVAVTAPGFWTGTTRALSAAGP